MANALGLSTVHMNMKLREIREAGLLTLEAIG